MKVVIGAVSSNRSLSGVSRHAANLAKCLLMRPEISALHVLVGEWEHECVKDAVSRSDRRLRIHPIPLRPGTLHRNLWYYWTLPAIADQFGADLVHLAYPSPINRKAFSCPVVVTLHDLYPYDIPSNFGFPKVLFNRVVLRHCLRKADAIACVSQSTRKRIGEIMPRVWPKTATIWNCAESGPPPRKPAFAASWNDQPFLLCVAQHRRNKNLPLALRVFKRSLAATPTAPAMRLVIVGLPGPESAKIQRFIRKANLHQSVSLVDGICDAELAWCYRNCELLLAPSAIEGFGLPVLEAQIAGCRVVCSDIPAFRELGSAQCSFVSLDSDAEQNFALAITESLKARRPGPSPPPHLSPSAISERYITLYKAILEGKGIQTVGTFASKAEQQQEIREPETAVSSGFSTTVRL